MQPRRLGRLDHDVLTHDQSRSGHDALDVDVDVDHITHDDVDGFDHHDDSGDHHDGGAG